MAESHNTETEKYMRDYTDNSVEDKKTTPKSYENSNSFNFPPHVESGTVCAKPTTPALYRPAPYSDDPEAIAEREECDYSIKITKDIAASGRAPRKIRICSDGIYDLFHQGHARQLMQAKNAFPNVYLIVIVSGDILTHKMKGKTVMTDDERFEAVRHCRYVDEVMRNGPWVLDEKFLEENKIDFVAHDDIPYSMGSKENDIYQHIKSKGMFIPTERTEGVSTSDLVARVIRNYDTYVIRNLSRGYTAKDLNISILNEKKFLLRNKIDMVIETLEKKKKEFCKRWEDRSKDSNGILSLFNREEQ